MANGVITWNGVASDTLGIVVSKVPSLNRPQRKYNSYSVPGRNGDIVVMQDAYAEYEQEYEIFTLDGAQADARAIVDWLYQDGWCELSDDWEPEYYRLAYFVGPVDIEPIMDEAAVCTITFRCRPQRYIVQNPVSVASGATLNNPTKHVAYPIITLTGSEIVTSMLNLETPYNISLDSVVVTWAPEWSNNIAFMFHSPSSSGGIEIATYRQSGTPASEGGSLISHVNSTGTLRFKPFRWSIYNVGIGRGMTLTPDTDYTISCNTTSGASKVWVGFFENDGSKKYYSSAEASRSGAGQLSLTFHVPSNCANTLIIFYRTDNTEGTFSSIMLASGTEIIPFQPYATEATETFTIGDTTLKFTTSGFTTAVIDCEKENFTVDGVNYNAKSMLLDQYGNYSAEYLKLGKGDNVVTYTSDITSATIEPKFWEL